MTALGAKQLLQHTRETTSAARVLRPITASGDVLDPCRSIYVKTGGTFDWEDAEVDANGDPDPNSDTMTVTDETWIPFSPNKVTAIVDAVIFQAF